MRDLVVGKMTKNIFLGGTGARGVGTDHTTCPQPGVWLMFA
jgi:hypothetical protein